MRVRATSYVSWDLGQGPETPGIVLEQDVDVLVDGSVYHRGTPPRVVGWAAGYNPERFPLPRWYQLSRNEQGRAQDVLDEAARVADSLRPLPYTLTEAA